MINWKQLINQAKMTPVDFTDKKPKSLNFDKKNGTNSANTGTKKVAKMNV